MGLGMKVKEMCDRFDLQLAGGEKGLDREVTGGYCGDLLSDVMANATGGTVWLTIQSHQNIIAVALLKELSAIILVNDQRPDDDTIKKAEDEGIPLLISKDSAFDLACKLYKSGIIK
jgi:predicted transcriptional regulator